MQRIFAKRYFWKTIGPVGRMARLGLHAS
jgi:hypothetical protein